MAKEQTAERARDEAGPECRISGQGADRGVVFRKEQIAEHQRGRGPIDEEVVPFQGRADRGGDQSMYDPIGRGSGGGCRAHWLAPGVCFVVGGVPPALARLWPCRVIPARSGHPDGRSGLTRGHEKCEIQAERWWWSAFCLISDGRVRVWPGATKGMRSLGMSRNGSSFRQRVRRSRRCSRRIPIRWSRTTSPPPRHGPTSTAIWIEMVHESVLGGGTSWILNSRSLISIGHVSVTPRCRVAPWHP